MKEDLIAEIGIDVTGRLYVRPSACKLPAIYRSAMEVHWDPEREVLYSPKPREWDYPTWFKQILLAAAYEYGIVLKVRQSTAWVNVAVALREEMEGFARLGLSEVLAKRELLGRGSWDELLTSQTLSQAAKAWDRGDYRRYVEIVMPIHAKLTPAQLKRLAIAERRAGE